MVELQFLLSGELLLLPDLVRQVRGSILKLKFRQAYQIIEPPQVWGIFSGLLFVLN